MFQSTRPCGARLQMEPATERDIWFQSTRPCGARLFRRRNGVLPETFQSTRPCGARLVPLRSVLVGARVSIHAPLRGATAGLSSIPSPLSSFNPRAPAGRDAGRQHRRRCGDVSIHAPLRGATFHWCLAPESQPVSIHAPLRGATTRTGGGIPKWLRFNPRAPAGRDQGLRHGATGRYRFNPRAPAGRDPGSAPLSNCAPWFQSTRPCGARLRPGAII